MNRRAFRGRGRGAVLWACAGVIAMSGCGPTRLNVKPDIPPLLMTPMPLAMGVRIPKSFAEYVQKENAQERQWEIRLGPGQADAIRRVTGAMFEHTLMLSDQAPGDEAAIAANKLNGILETTLDSYVYLLPTPGGSEYYSATIGYKVNLLAVDGRVLGSWIYEGYGSAPARGLGSAKGVEMVTGLAIRDACANLAVHLPDQELVRDLLNPPAPTPATPSASTPAPGAAPASEGPPAATAPNGAAPSPEASSNGAAGASTGAASAATQPATPPATEADPKSKITPDAESPAPAEPVAQPSATPTAPETPPAPGTPDVQPTTGN